MSLRIYEHSPFQDNSNHRLEDFTSVSSRWDEVSTPGVISSPDLKFVDIVDN